MTLCGAAAFFSPFSVFTYFPVLNQIAEDLGITIQLMSLTITMYLAVQGIVPVVLGDLADQFEAHTAHRLTLFHSEQAFLTLNVDLHPDETGLASAAASLVRCLAGAVGVTFLQPLMDRAGPAWSFTFIGLLGGALPLPALLVLRGMGPGWRNCPVRRAESSESEGNDGSLFV